MPRPIVHMYMQDWLPATNGTGTHNRIFSNLRAYLDLGYEVEVVCFRSKSDLEFVPLTEMENVRWTFVDRNGRGRNIDRFCYLTNLGEDRALDYRFKNRGTVRAEISKRVQQDPMALHHFEYLNTACAYINLPNCKPIWSMHDLESKFSDAHRQIRSELNNGRQYSWERRARKYLELAEIKAARQSALTLCIARHEKEFLRDEWKCRQAEFFPMSLPDETAPHRETPLGRGDVFRILHLGRVDSLPSYRSLEFLFAEVFPLIRPEIASKMEFMVVGELRDSAKTERIKQLAASFPFTRFLGFQKDLRDQYSMADLQVVGSTAATGLRTRIVESFAYNVPVLSTTVGAEGVEGLISERNIHLADTAVEFASRVEQLIAEPDSLAEIAAEGRKLYDEMYSRRAVARRLEALLKKYCV